MSSERGGDETIFLVCYRSGRGKHVGGKERGGNGLDSVVPSSAITATESAHARAVGSSGKWEREESSEEEANLPQVFLSSLQYSVLK